MFVYKLYDQTALDRQYNNRLHVTDFQNYLNRWDLLSREAEKNLPLIKDVPYGDLPRESLDVYPSSKSQSKVLIFIHGGYWQMLDKAMFHFIANGFSAYGITTVLLNYPLAPEASIDQIVHSCRNAIYWLYGNVSAFNGDQMQMYIAGHSAGGHLAAMHMATDWKFFYPDVPPTILKGGCFVSGLFDLVPIHLSYLNHTLRMDLETAIRNSPVNRVPSYPSNLIVAVGEGETKEFHDQSNKLYDCWKDSQRSIELLRLPQMNHFSIVESMVDPNAALHQSICTLMNLEMN